MKYTKYILAVLFICILSIGIIGATDKMRGEYQVSSLPVKEQVVLRTALPDVPDKVFILSIEDKEINETKAKRISEKVIGSNKTNKSLKLFGKGQMKYSTGKEWTDNFTKKELLNEEQAKTKALGYIKKLAKEDLIDNNMVNSSKLEVVYDETFVVKDGKTESFVTNQHINMPLSVDGIPLHGGGAKVRVYLVKGGEMAGLTNGVGKLKKDKQVPIITPDEAINSLKENGYKNMTIDSLELAYEVLPPEENESFVYPVYVFKGLSHGPEGDNVSFYTNVPAVRKE